eukprot:4586825-Karenia_brevis.AAC.1
MLATTDNTEYLGRRLCLGSLHTSEIDSRLEKAWKKFFAWKSDLCGTWTLTAERERKIRSVQRRMLRWILGTGRR